MSEVQHNKPNGYLPSRHFWSSMGILVTIMIVVNGVMWSELKYVQRKQLEDHDKIIAIEKDPTVRADPFTGRDGDKLAKAIETNTTLVLEIINELNDLKVEVAKLPPDIWERRIEALEHQAIRNDSNYSVPKQ